MQMLTPVDERPKIASGPGLFGSTEPTMPPGIAARHFRQRTGPRGKARRNSVAHTTIHGVRPRRQGLPPEGRTGPDVDRPWSSVSCSVKLLVEAVSPGRLSYKVVCTVKLLIKPVPSRSLICPVKLLIEAVPSGSLSRRVQYF
jgi:hypothetical protein